MIVFYAVVEPADFQLALNFVPCFYVVPVSAILHIYTSVLLL